ncbi:DUF3107 family protein [Corynebacterium poyangense]|uniref:DUF3107 family protein n=1 Tax=Corynebacterium poyangense TaxID=2684405 RepID=A0A7H0SML7_9CORY|nr:DUF3107 domain-containing protein [Corynebacterium poyangense]MBZ8176898.1 DUF3107 family protein [Corynebacterium poyangense]QNQ89792.1 DUF3107 family protein [Corynebacterium poyangense]
MSVDIKIGFVGSQRELAIASREERDALNNKISAALTADGESVLELDDTVGHRYLIRTSRIAWVEVGEGHSRQVGFIGN